MMNISLKCEKYNNFTEELEKSDFLVQKFCFHKYVKNV